MRGLSDVSATRLDKNEDLALNASPDKIKSCQSLNIFKRQLKLFLLSRLL